MAAGRFAAQTCCHSANAHATWWGASGGSSSAGIHVPAAWPSSATSVGEGREAVVQLARSAIGCGPFAVIQSGSTVVIEVFVESIRVNMTNYKRVVMLKE